VRRYSLFFEYEDKPGFGYEFPCNAEGVVNAESMCEQSRRTFILCVAGEIDGHKVVRRRIIEYGDQSKTGVAIEKCGCCKVMSMEPDPEPGLLSGLVNPRTINVDGSLPLDWWEML